MWQDSLNVPCMLGEGTQPCPAPEPGLQDATQTYPTEEGCALPLGVTCVAAQNPKKGH